MDEVWFRYEDYLTAAPVDEFERAIGEGQVHVRMVKIPVVRHTPKGVWLYTWKGERWVSRTTNKRYACPTEAEALKSFKARKRRQIGILSAQRRNAERALALADGKDMIEIELGQFYLPEAAE